MAAQAIDPLIKLEEFKLIDEDVVLLHFKGVKWYEDYDDVKAHHRLLDEANEQGCAWQFCRVGEETGNIEYESDDAYDDEGNTINCPDIIMPSQSVYVETEGEPYPIGESLTTEDN